MYYDIYIYIIYIMYIYIYIYILYKYTYINICHVIQLHPILLHPCSSLVTILMSFVTILYERNADILYL